jgi:anti-sigma factor RsiW
MNRCQEIRAQMTFYLDDELQGPERVAIEMHLSDCETCREIFAKEQRFLETIRGLRPLYTATPALHTQVEKILGSAPAPYTAPPALRQRVERSLWQFCSSLIDLINTRWIRIAVVAVVLAMLVSVWGVTQYTNNARHHPPSDFALMAVETHQRHLRGQLPLEITSGAAEQISAWFADKVDFRVELPNYQELSGQTKLYDIEGARLVGYKNDYAAYVAYQMQRRLISLVVTSAAIAQPAGGEEIVSRGITFHYASLSGWKVITWSDRGLTYALVSDFEKRGQQSCLVCHQGTKDQDFVETLKQK